MKRVLFALVLVGLVSALGFAQKQNNLPNQLTLVKTHTTFTATSDDTTGFITVPVVSLLDATEVIFIGIATDSIAADLYFIGRNGTLTSVTETYADSIVGTSNTSNVYRTVLKDASVNRLEGLTDVKIGTVFRAAGQGTTAGRTFKQYLFWKQ